LRDGDVLVKLRMPIECTVFAPDHKINSASTLDQTSLWGRSRRSTAMLGVESTELGVLSHSGVIYVNEN